MTPPWRPTRWQLLASWRAAPPSSSLLIRVDQESSVSVAAVSATLDAAVPGDGSLAVDDRAEATFPAETPPVNAALPSRLGVPAAPTGNGRPAPLVPVPNAPATPTPPAPPAPRPTRPAAAARAAAAPDNVAA